MTHHSIIFKFLVIDDDNINNMVCKAAIRSAMNSYQPLAKSQQPNTVCFTNPLEGLAYVKNKYAAFDEKQHTILFLDLNMPEMNGFEWLENYKDLSETIKTQISIYILSSSVSPSDIELAHSNPFVKEYLVKPLTKVKVREIIETHSGNKFEMQVA